MIRVDIKRTKKWTIDALHVIRDANCDALLLGGFSGAVIEFFGRCLRIHDWKDKSEKGKCFGDFLEKYLPLYAKHKDILWSILRCEGAHAILAQSGVTLTCEKEDESKHLKGQHRPEMGYSLIIYSPQFMKDLENAILDFFSEVEKKSDLEEKINTTFNEVYNKGQSFVEKKVKKGELKIKIEEDAISTGSPFSSNSDIVPGDQTS